MKRDLLTGSVNKMAALLTHYRQNTVKSLALMVLTLTGIVIPPYVHSQDFPTRPIKILAPYVAGASTDALARTVAQGMSQILGQAVLVENRPGAGGIVAADLLAKAPADGYTIMLTSEGILTMNPSLYKKISYDPVKDFDPLTIAVRMPLLIVANPAQPFNTVSELLRLAKASPASLSYGSAGVGSSQHMAGELFKLMSGVDILHVPYKGGAPAMNDLLGNQVSLMFVQLPSALSQVRANRIKVIAIGSPTRNPQLPDVPTVDEAGVIGYNSDTWYGFNMPHGVPENIAKILHDAIVKSLEMNRARLANDGFFIDGGSRQEMAQTVERDLIKWATVVKQAGIAPQ